jgi:hypothetical protein
VSECVDPTPDPIELRSHHALLNLMPAQPAGTELLEGDHPELLRRH